MLTQEQYNLFTGQSVSYSETDWIAIVTSASLRLASFLCLDEFPELTDDNLDLAELLSNFIAGILKFQGGADIEESKSVRNFTIRFRTSSAANAFSLIVKQYGDIVEKYSECGLGFSVEHGKGCSCDKYYGF